MLFGESFKSIISSITDATSGLFDFNKEAKETGGSTNNDSVDPLPEVDPTKRKSVNGALFNVGSTQRDLLTLQAGLNKTQDDFNETTSEGIEFGQALQSTISSGVVSFAETLGDVFSGDAGAKGFFNSMLILVADFADQLGRMIVGIGVASLSLKSVFSNPYGAIVAGSTLIALSGMAKNLMEKGIDDSGSGNAKPAQLATGGIIPSGFPNDTFPAMLSSGETVLPSTKPLPDLNSGSSSGMNYNNMKRAFSDALRGASLKASGSDLKLVLNNYQSGRSR